MKIFGKLMMILCLICCFSFYTTKTEAVNVSNQREQAHLIEKYLIGHKDNIIDYASKYKFLNDNDIQKNLDKIDDIINKLRVVQSDNNSTLSVTNLIQEIKKINEEMKILLAVKKNEYIKYLNVKKLEYQDLGQKLSVKLDEIYLMMYDSSKLEKDNLTEREKEIKSSLKALRILSKEIQFFGLKEYETEEELQASFIGALNSIKYHISILKKNIQ